MNEAYAQPSQQRDQRLGVSRREFIQKGITVAGWGTLFLGAGAGIYQCIRFFYPSVVFHPPSVFQIGRVKDFLSTEPSDAYGVIFVDSRFKQAHRFFVVREADRIYALFARCTHLGCTVNWFPGLRIFKCPCHGSEFHSNGKEFAGPAPRPLDRLKIDLDMDENILVDTRTVFTAKEFEQKKAYIEVI
jgi:cytochrome b6-f complex iron-sulfur subunit